MVVHPEGAFIFPYVSPRFVTAVPVGPRSAPTLGPVVRRSGCLVLSAVHRLRCGQAGF